MMEDDIGDEVNVGDKRLSQEEFKIEEEENMC